MSKDLKAYMVGLAIDPEQLSDFISDPGKAMERAGLTSEDQAALLSGDQSRIFAALAKAKKTKESEPASGRDLPPASTPHPNWPSPGTAGWQPNVLPLPWGPSAAMCWWLWRGPWR